MGRAARGHAEADGAGGDDLSLIHIVRRLRREQTEAEKFLWRRLRNKQVEGAKFRRQQPIGPYIVDFVCLEKKVIIEVDGGHHNEAEVSVNDDDRAKWLSSEGYRVLRFWNNEVLNDTGSVTERIREVVSPSL